MPEPLTPAIRERLELYDERGNVVSSRDIVAVLATVDALRARAEKSENERDDIQRARLKEVERREKAEARVAELEDRYLVPTVSGERVCGLERLQERLAEEMRKRQRAEAAVLHERERADANWRGLKKAEAERDTANRTRKALAVANRDLLAERDEVVNALRVGVERDLGTPVDEQSPQALDLVLAYGAALDDARVKAEAERDEAMRLGQNNLDLARATQAKLDEARDALTQLAKEPSGQDRAQTPPR
jgi:hypothetical protein